MKAHQAWNYSPFIPMNGAKAPYICAVRPENQGFSGEWLGEDGTLFYRRRFDCEWAELPVTEKTFSVSGLQDNTDYELYIHSGDADSITRLVRTGEIPGSVVFYLHPEDKAYAFSGRYPASPSFVRLSSGRIIASFDIFAFGSGQNFTMLFYSDDGGDCWKWLTELFPCFWGKLFLRGDELYMLAVSREYGDLLIGKSTDGGQNWSAPTVLLRGMGNGYGGCHKAPVPVVLCDGRLWTAFEAGSWQNSFSMRVASAPVNADLLDAECWSFSDPAPFEREFMPDVSESAAIEGNVAVSPSGEVYVLYRICRGRALLMKADRKNPEAPLTFVCAPEFPMGHTKFDIFNYGGMYYAVGNTVDESYSPRPLRNVLELACSHDLVHWEIIQDLLDYRKYDKMFIAFQYPCAATDGEMLYVLSRTAFNGASNYHDNNCVTFHKFREVICRTT